MLGGANTVITQKSLTKDKMMFRNNISVYVDDEEMAKKVREYAQKLRQERGQRTYTKPISESPKLMPDIEMPKLPAFLLDVMNGGTFPAQEDLTRAEQAIMYDAVINPLVNLYRQTKKAEIAQQIRKRLDELGVDF